MSPRRTDADAAAEAMATTAADARCANLLGALSLTVVDGIRDAVEAAAGRAGSAPEALVLLHDEPGMSQEELRVGLRLSQPGVVRLVDSLEAEGLVRRGRGPDERTHALRLTSAGRRRVRALLIARAGVLREIVDPLPSVDRRRLESLLSRAIEGLVRDEAHGIQICRLCDAGACPLERCPAELGAASPGRTAQSSCRRDRTGTARTPGNIER